MTKPVAVVIGATSKWQSDGRNTRMVHGGNIPDDRIAAIDTVGSRGRHSAEICARGFPCSADHKKQAQCFGAGGGDIF